MRRRLNSTQLNLNQGSLVTKMNVYIYIEECKKFSNDLLVFNVKLSEALK